MTSTSWSYRVSPVVKNPRWYSSYLNQFIQPDTLIPDPGNSADWNRYAYVNYNPINFNDPTGHIGQDPPQIDDDTLQAEIDYYVGSYFAKKESLINELKDRFNWTVSGSVTIAQLETILTAGNTYSLGINEMFSSFDGDEWVRRNMGGATFKIGGVVQNVVAKYNQNPYISLVLGNVWLTPELENLTNPVQTVMHELVHFMEAKDKPGSLWFGGGVSDDFIRFLGGTTPQGTRWKNKTSGMLVSSPYLWDTPRSSEDYGNNSTVDSWAEAFSWYFIDPSVLPNNGGENLMHTYIIRYVFNH